MVHRAANRTLLRDAPPQVDLRVGFKEYWDDLAQKNEVELKRFWRVMSQGEVGRRWRSLAIMMGRHAGMSDADIGGWVRLSRWRVREIAKKIEAEITTNWIRGILDEEGIPHD